MRGLFAIALLSACAPSTSAMAQSSWPLVPRDFAVPEGLVTPDFQLRKMTIDEVVRDYDAVMASKAQLQQIYGGSWPEGMTIGEDLADLGWHQGEWARRNSFAYIVLSPDGTKSLGCVYVYPTQKQGYDAQVNLWARESLIGDPADQALETAVKQWMASAWPFRNVGYPGRTIAQEEWAALPDVARPVR
ncbi:twin-arginine translocation pathway signal protein [Croceibacterium sp. TMG7-5b_MA50]|uniref:twin-arginine translocation pathway signal protein n=1 Tax=Croceibacterium sp. TMG7-5b_MA50 TaxID=3121290 RepID=UPI003221FBFD